MEFSLARREDGQLIGYMAVIFAELLASVHGGCIIKSPPAFEYRPDSHLLDHVPQ
jgi:hypothetical protein